jgi:hypothetical protein
MLSVKKCSLSALCVLVLAASCSLVILVLASTASAASPWWQVTVGSRPSVLPAEPEAKGEIVITAANLGDATADGQAIPVTVAPVLPAGLQVRSVEALAGSSGPGSRGPVACTKTPLVCTFEGTLPPYDLIEVRVKVEVLEGAVSGELVGASVSGGGALPVHVSHPLTFAGEATPFGIQNYELASEAEGGGPATQAGAHPFQLNTTFELNQTAAVRSAGEYEATVPALAKDVRFHWPAGLLGNPIPLPRCTLAQFLSNIEEGDGEVNACPTQSAVGVAMVTVDEPKNIGMTTLTVPIFNLEPAFGEPARFGFYLAPPGIPILIDPSVRSADGEDYGITVASTNIPQIASLLSVRAIVWGVPDDPSHDNSRGWACLNATRELPHNSACEPSTVAHPPAFLVAPTSCSGNPLTTSVEADSWTGPLEPISLAATVPMPALDGCNRLGFGPAIHSEPTSNEAMTPTGLAFDMNVNDEGITRGTGLAQSDLAKAVVTLPVGVTTNPSVAAGLSACTRAEYESEDINATPGTGCTAESKIGEVEIESPLVSQKIVGSVYLAKQNENPYGSLLALYVVARNPEIGVLIRVAGKVEPDPVTGQLVTTFENVPQLPFSHFHFAFRQGQRAPLATPAACGTYTTTADLTPYSDPSRVLHDTAQFTITSGPEGAPCPSGGTPPFHPVVTAGTVNNAAGSYSPMYLQVTRKDTEQEITRFSAQLPSGLTANLSGVPFCPDQDIELAKTKSGASEEAEPSCPGASQIGHTQVGVGVGSVLAWSSGRLYLAGPYNGAPFSVVAINSAKVGPFDLGTVVVREALSINPETAVVTIDAKASDPIPHILDGIVIHARDIRVYVDRPDFSLNPTNCDPKVFSATVDGAGADPANPADQAPVTVGDSFQIADCANLAFKPSFKVSTSGRTSRKTGAGLSVRLAYPAAPQGTQANIRSVKVDLPKQLPSRLTTLQKACPDSTFNANPAACPTDAIVGHARAITPILPVALEGPAYFVSHGGAKFPELIVVLQGYGVTIYLHGETFINKAGITSSTFRSVPDQPVTSFELTLPQGLDSALAANGDLCKSALKMPTAFTAQNGATIKQNTPITVTGCPKHKAKTKKTKNRHHKSSPK